MDIILRQPVRTRCSSFSPSNLLLPSHSYTVPLFLNLHTFHPSPLKRLTATNNDAASVKAVEFDSSLAAKSKAVDISPDLKGASIYLVGISSTTKTRLGKLLAETLRYYFFDSDSLIEEAAGSEPGSKSFRERDEQGFRDSETEVLKQLSAMGRLVVSAGNGAVQSSTNLALLRHGITIWIDVPLDLVSKEILEDGVQLPQSEMSTPGQILPQVSQLYEEMKGGYATADATVSLWKVASQLGYDDFEAVSMDDMCLEVLKEIEKLLRVKKLMEAAAKPF